MYTIYVLIVKLGNLLSSVTFDDRFTHMDNTGPRGRTFFVISLRFIFRLITKKSHGKSHLSLGYMFEKTKFPITSKCH